MSGWEADEQRWSEMLAGAQAGDQQAYQRLLEELARVIRAYLIARFGRLELLDDCVQECLLAIHQARHTYDVARPLRPWLFAIVRHRTIDLLRKNPVVSASAEEPVDDGQMADVDRAVDGARLLSGLSKNLRDALYLTKMLGFSVSESAERLGVSESVVKVRVHRGLRKLKAAWELEAP